MLRGGILLGLALIAGCRSPNAGSATSGSQPEVFHSSAAQQMTPPASPGSFDFYLFTLSWAPEYCHGHRGSPECDGQHPGFVVHGLWPQNFDGTWPQACSSAPGLSDPDSMLDIMPDPHLVAHEWEKHGTCSGLSPEQYFATVRRAWESVKQPAMFSRGGETRASANEIQQAFPQANPGMSPEDVAVECDNRYFAGVSVCLDKTLKPTACRGVQSCTQDWIRITHLGE